MNRTKLDLALLYQDKLKWSIIPCNGKNALIHWSKYEKELSTEQGIDSWWSQFPDANVAVVLGKHSGIIALDVDDIKYFRDKGFEIPHTPKALSGGEASIISLNIPMRVINALRITRRKSLKTITPRRNLVLGVKISI